MSGNGLLKADNDDDEQVFVVDYTLSLTQR